MEILHITHKSDSKTKKKYFNYRKKVYDKNPEVLGHFSIEENNCESFVVYSNKKPIGLFCFVNIQSTWFMQTAFLEKEYRGKGILYKLDEMYFKEYNWIVSVLINDSMWSYCLKHNKRTVKMI